MTNIVPHQAEGFTTEELAEMLNRPVRTVREQLAKNAENFIIGTRETGRGVKPAIYDPAVIYLLTNATPAEIKKITKQGKVRKGRDDAGGVRGCKADEWQIIKTMVKSTYMDSRGTLKDACYHVEQMLLKAGQKVEFQIYRRLSQKRIGSDGFPSGEFHREGWQVTRDFRFKKKNFANAITNTVRYDMFSILESAKIIGRGYGSGRIWVIDGHKFDSWVRNGKELKMPFAVAIIDGVTRFPLHFEVAESESSETVLNAILKCGFRWGFPDYAVVMDNGRAMRSMDVTDVVMSLWSDEELVNYATGKVPAFRELFDAHNSPIITNRPHIPRYPFKSYVENFFGLVKKFDKMANPLNYQGGDRKETTQLSVSGMQMMLPETMTEEEYWSKFNTWLYGDFITQPRPDMLRTFHQQTGLMPTIENAFNYYRDPNKFRLPPDSKIWRLLYGATPVRHRVRAGLGSVEIQVNKQRWKYTTPLLDHHYAGRFVTVLPIPDNEQQAIVVLSEDESKPRFIGTAFNVHVRHIDHVTTAKSYAKHTRDTIREKIQDEISRDPLIVWEPQTLPKPQPELPSGVQAWFEPVKPQLVETTEVELEPAKIVDEKNKIDPSVAKLLDGIFNDLTEE